MSLTHELRPIEGASAPANNFGTKLDRLLANGFELLKDLTGEQPEAFSGLYLGWYSEASGLIRQLAPGRSAEFDRLYRPERRRRLDYETYVIEDYLLGVSLHGGFGRLDAMRAIAARRFHLQLLLLKSLQPAMRLGLEDLRRELGHELTTELMNQARQAIAADKGELAVHLSMTALRLRLKSILDRHKIKQPRTASLPAMAKLLSEASLLKAEGIAIIDQLEESAKAPEILPAKATSSCRDCANLIEQLR